jgi:Na+/proline symporter
VVTNFLTTISGAWEFIINASAGMGAVLILRWYWWRINAWSEIAAMIAPLIIYPVARYTLDIQPPITLYPTVLGTTIIWLIVTYLTEPVEESKLIEFYRRVHPGGIGWKHIAARVTDVKAKGKLSVLLLNWMLGIVLVYSFLFGFGKIIFTEYLSGFIILAVGILAAWIIYLNLQKSGFETVAKSK